MRAVWCEGSQIVALQSAHTGWPLLTTTQPTRPCPRVFAGCMWVLGVHERASQPGMSGRVSTATLCYMMHTRAICCNLLLRALPVYHFCRRESGVDAIIRPTSRYHRPRPVQQLVRAAGPGLPYCSGPRGVTLQQCSVGAAYVSAADEQQQAAAADVGALQHTAWQDATPVAGAQFTDAGAQHRQVCVCDSDIACTVCYVTFIKTHKVHLQIVEARSKHCLFASAGLQSCIFRVVRSHAWLKSGG